MWYVVYKHSGMYSILYTYIHTHIYILSKCNIVRTCSEFVKMTSHQDDVPSTRNTWAWPLRFGTTSLPAAAFMVSMRGCASNVPKNPSGLNSWRRGQWVLKQPASSCNPLTTYTVYCMYTIRYRYMHIHIIYKHTYSEGWRLAHPTFCEDEEAILWSIRQLHLPRWSRNLWSFRTSPPSRPNSWDFIINRPYIQGFNGLHICQPVLHPVWDS